MKYDEFNGHTFNKKWNKDNDPDGLGILLSSIDESSVEDSVADMVAHPLLKQVDNVQPVALQIYGCPICKNVYFTKEEAIGCSDGLRAMIERFKNIKVGDWVKYVVKEGQFLDAWTGLSVGDVFYSRVTRLSHCWNGYRCDTIITIHADGDYIDGSNMSRWWPATEEEAKEHERKKKLAEIEKLQKDLQSDS